MRRPSASRTTGWGGAGAEPPPGAVCRFSPRKKKPPQKIVQKHVLGGRPACRLLTPRLSSRRRQGAFKYRRLLALTGRIHVADGARARARVGHVAGGGVMLWVYVPRGTSLDRVPVTSDADVPDSATWFDLVNPNHLEDKIVERRVGIAVPTREEMQEIEVTSRLYVENGARYTTPPL